jgi:hypothetical protein
LAAKYENMGRKIKTVQREKVVEYHKIFDYFLNRFGFTIVGTIEPLPGIPPTTKHIADVEKLIEREQVKFILQDVYNPQDASLYLSKRLNVKLIVMPHDVGAVQEADNVFSVFQRNREEIDQWLIFFFLHSFSLSCCSAFIPSLDWKSSERNYFYGPCNRSDVGVWSGTFHPFLRRTFYLPAFTCFCFTCRTCHCTRIQADYIT